MIGAVELGGTKINVAVGTGPGNLAAKGMIPTTTPDETLAAIIAFLRAHGPLDAVGIASFGPVCLDRHASAWGQITATTKPLWSHTPVATVIRDALDVAVAFDTDVNGAALGEYHWGALAGCGVGLYITVGTGIGGGVIIDGKPLHGLVHPELGHVRIKRQGDDDFPGLCPFHGDCIEGLASGPAIMARLGCSLSDLASDDPRTAPVFDALGQAIAGYALTLSPHRIVVGGGVAKTPGFHHRLTQSVQHWLGDYVVLPQDYVVPPALGDEAGVLGAIALAQTLDDSR
jgi:fructokinase